MKNKRTFKTVLTQEGTRDEAKNLLTFGGHIRVLRMMLIRIILVVIVLGSIVFCLKVQTFRILLAPHSSDFCTFRVLKSMLTYFGMEKSLAGETYVPLISTELSAQFMTHITVSCMLGILLASPYILFELFRFISPALYDSEKKYSVCVTCIIYGLFISGVLMSYYLLFPVAFQFLANYRVDDSIISTITIDSYISTFVTLTFMMGIVFQLPVIAFILGKMGFIDASLLRRYRPYALVFIMIIAAVITPPDLFTLLLVTIPIYGLYEISILVLKWSRMKRKE